MPKYLATLASKIQIRTKQEKGFLGEAAPRQSFALPCPAAQMQPHAAMLRPLEQAAALQARSGSGSLEGNKMSARPTQPHFFEPSTAKLGDCSVCGHVQDSLLHITQFQSEGNGTPLDRAWELVDALQPGIAQLSARAQLVVAFASLFEASHQAIAARAALQRELDRAKVTMQSALDLIDRPVSVRSDGVDEWPPLEAIIQAARSKLIQTKELLQRALENV